MGIGWPTGWADLIRTAHWISGSAVVLVVLVERYQLQWSQPTARPTCSSPPSQRELSAARGRERRSLPQKRKLAILPAMSAARLPAGVLIDIS